MKELFTFIGQIVGGIFYGIIIAVIVMPAISFVELFVKDKNHTFAEKIIQCVACIVFFLIPAVILVLYISKSTPMLFVAICVAFLFHWKAEAGNSKENPSSEDLLENKEDLQKIQKIKNPTPLIRIKKNLNNKNEGEWKQRQLFDDD